MECRFIEGYDDYLVFADGNVYSRKSKRMMTPNDRGNGYLRVTLSRSGKAKCHDIHRLVAQAFIPNPQGKSEVNHIDGDKTNNRVDNLEWVTPSENQRHAAMVGLHTFISISKAVGQYTIDGKYVRAYESTKQAGRMTNIPQACISRACTGKQATAGGFKWKYK